ncbi:MAG: hypothetical protein MUF21_08200 [Gemmatimonadaceae bacterium]|jgi:hypothetical protein|nr:hypothetical protein [Gemmatimonadaceae bacterium]
MWADQLLALEKAHVDRLLVWGFASLLTGLTVQLALRGKGTQAPLLRHFAIQTWAWGAVDLAIAFWALRGLALRDFEGMVSLDRFLWFNCGLDAGYMAVGATLALCGWKLRGGGGLSGAGLGVLVQGAALLLLDLRLALQLGAMR